MQVIVNIFDGRGERIGIFNGDGVVDKGADNKIDKAFQLLLCKISKRFVGILQFLCVDITS